MSAGLPAAAQVAVLVDGPSDLDKARTRALAVEVQQLTRDDPNPVKMPDAPTHVGDYTLAGVKRELKRALADRSVRAVVGFGLLAGIAVGELDKAPSKPIVLPYAAPEIQGLPRAANGTGVRNLAYITGLVEFDKDVSRFREVIRDRKVALLIDKYAWEIVLKRRPKGLVLPGENRDDVVVVPAPDAVEDVLAALPSDVEAVYLFPHFRRSFAQKTRLIEALNERKIATYAAGGPEWVEKGAFVTLTPGDLETERFRRAALYLRDGLSGDRLDRVPTAFARRTELVINMATARRIGIFPRFELMTEARLVGRDQKTRGERLTMSEAITQAIANNPAQASLREQRKAAEGELRETRGNLLPRLDASGSFTWIDPDVTSDLFNAERTVDWGLTASQLIYSPLAYSAYFAQKDFVRSVEQQVAAGRLDLVLEVVQSYLRVLQTEAIERLNRQNLARVRTNRGLAELRVEIGSSGPQDIARWDIELADGRAETILAGATRNQAEIDLNRILAAPSERAFETVDPEKDSEAILVDPRAQKYVEDLQSFRIFRAFMAQEALGRSPELKELDAQIASQDDLIQGVQLQLFIPSVSTAFGFTNVLDRSGSGSGSVAGGGMGIPIPERDDFTWQWGINLNFTLFDDTRYGTLERLRRTRAQLMNVRRDTANRIEQLVRSALHQAGASGAAVDLRRDAVAAAKINLDAVTGAYRQGTVNIITLIDAQNQALAAEINAANALYQFLSDFAAAERASGQFIILQPADERDDFFRRLEAFAAESRAEAP